MSPEPHGGPPPAHPTPERFPLQRRQFSALAAASLGLGLARTAGAAIDPALVPVNAQQYQALGKPVPVTPPAGTVDVVEFFSYACPHCFEFEPMLENWLKAKPATIHFHRSPVHFLQNSANFQPMYFALETMGLADAMQLKVFNAVHLEHQRLDKPDAIAAFMAKNGVDATRFMSIFNSFGVRTKVAQANQLFDAFGIDGVPTLGVQGRFQTSPQLAKGEAQALAVVDYLVAQVRAGH